MSIRVTSGKVCKCCFILLAVAAGLLSAGASAQTETVLYNFTGAADGGIPESALTFYNGHLYGTASTGGLYGQGVAFELTRSGSGWTETVIYNFGGFKADGRNPQEKMLVDWRGNLFGTTLNGGKNGDGTAFELYHDATGWHETIVHTFGPLSGPETDGAYPRGPLSFGPGGKLYGTTESGGNMACFQGCGVIFELGREGGEWNERIIYYFQPSGTGYAPEGELVFVNGNMYGTTLAGGTFLEGTVFELSPASGDSWSETVIHNFGGSDDGSSPTYGLTRGRGGNLYGTAGGGTGGNGIVFELTPNSDSWNYNILYSFSGEASGSFPSSGVTVDREGNLYGENGGDPQTSGVIYKLTPSNTGWTEDTLYSLASDSLSGNGPIGGLVLGPAGKLYGVTQYGGNTTSSSNCFAGCGVVFSLSH